MHNFLFRKLNICTEKKENYTSFREKNVETKARFMLVNGNILKSTYKINKIEFSQNVVNYFRLRQEINDVYLMPLNTKHIVFIQVNADEQSQQPKRGRDGGQPCPGPQICPR